jgi:Domain of unknown function (DUF3291)
MNAQGYHLAQFNLARAKAPLDDPRMRGFVEQLRPINELADRDPGHVWRLHTETGDATGIRPYPEDPSLLLTLSVWMSIDALVDFTYRGPHANVMRDRAEWFSAIEEHYIVLWFIPAGTLPSLDEAKERLAYLRAHGLTPHAFTFKKRFSTEEAEEYEFMKEGAGSS